MRYSLTDAEEKSNSTLTSDPQLAWVMDHRHAVECCQNVNKATNGVWSRLAPTLNGMWIVEVNVPDNGVWYLG